MVKRLTIIGAGIPGLSLGLDCLSRFGASGVKVQLFDCASRPKPTQAHDQRTTAFLPPAEDYFRGLGVWQSVERSAAALQQLRIVDDRGARFSAPLVETFDAAEFGTRPFAHNVANGVLRLALLDRLEALGGESHFDHALTPDDLDALQAKGLVVGADGQNSAVRRHIGIALDQRTPNQTAIVCTATHSLDQHGVSTEFHRDAGPFTLVPATPANPDDSASAGGSIHHRTAIVWVETPATAQALVNLEPAEFARRLQGNARGLLGEVFATTAPQAIRVATQQSVSLGVPGTLLVAEAAHALPPIGAQGLNTSIADVAALAALLPTYDDWRGEGLLQAYERARSADIGLRLNATHALNRITIWQSSLRDPLTWGVLGLVKHIKPLRRGLVAKGLG